MNCALSILLPFSCLSKRVSTKTRAYKKRKFLHNRVKKEKKRYKKVVLFFLANYLIKVSLTLHKTEIKIKKVPHFNKLAVALFYI
jgi:hypothetical protein